MYSMIVNKYGSPDNLEYQETKSIEIKSNLIRLDVKAAGVNFADILTIKGRYQERPRPPFSPGLEVSGKIIEIGNKVFNHKVGDHVMSIMKYGGYQSEVVVPEAKPTITILPFQFKDLIESKEYWPPIISITTSILFILSFDSSVLNIFLL